MANKNIITSAAKTVQVEQSYYSPSATIPNTNNPIGQIYCFLSKVDPWPDDKDPPVPLQDTLSIKKMYKNIFAVKHVTSNDISPVIERIDWVSGEVYDYYDDSVDMLEKDENGFILKHFYVKNKYDQVFKCLWNNNDGLSTTEPYFEPGTYGSNNLFLGSDGYKWKYIYTIDIGQKNKFMDKNWMPVPVGDSAPNPLNVNAGYGDIEVINVTSGGSLYNPTVPPTITIVGDGIGATATPVIVSNTITNILVTGAGKNYTYANVSITGTFGSGAAAFAPVSPIGGHGHDPISELGCTHVMYTVSFEGNESGNIPIDIDFHQVGLLVNPTSLQTNPDPANTLVYRTTTDLVMALGQGLYSPDEWVYQGTSLATATFKANVLSFDSASNVVRLINITGTPVLNNPLFGDTSKTVRTLLSVSYPNFTLFSGHPIFVENRTGVQRSSDGIEQFRFVLGY